jgi:hypothetical protein
MLVYFVHFDIIFIFRNIWTRLGGSFWIGSAGFVPAILLIKEPMPKRGLSFTSLFLEATIG